MLAKLKVRTGGSFLWLRTIDSTLLGQGADSLVFISIAFWGVMPPAVLGSTAASQWLFKVAYEVVATPFPYWIVNRLKALEGVDYFDRETDFNPLIMK